MYCCHRVSTQMRLNIIYIYIISYIALFSDAVRGISHKALGTLPEDGNVIPKRVGATIHNLIYLMNISCIYWFSSTYSEIIITDSIEPPYKSTYNKRTFTQTTSYSEDILLYSGTRQHVMCQNSTQLCQNLLSPHSVLNLKRACFSETSVTI
jgi:hypothetical protein